MPLGSLRQRTTGDLSQQEFLDVLVGTEVGHAQLFQACCGRGFFLHWHLGNVESGEWKRAPGRAPQHGASVATIHAAAIGGCRKPGRGRFGALSATSQPPNRPQTTPTGRRQASIGAATSEMPFVGGVWIAPDPGNFDLSKDNCTHSRLFKASLARRNKVYR